MVSTNEQPEGMPERKKYVEKMKRQHADIFIAHTGTAVVGYRSASADYEFLHVCDTKKDSEFTVGIHTGTVVQANINGTSVGLSKKECRLCNLFLKQVKKSFQMIPPRTRRAS